jgi:hypothetical protein
LVGDRDAVRLLIRRIEVYAQILPIDTDYSRQQRQPPTTSSLTLLVGI